MFWAIFGRPWLSGVYICELAVERPLRPQTIEPDESPKTNKHPACTAALTGTRAGSRAGSNSFKSHHFDTKYASSCPADRDAAAIVDVQFKVRMCRVR